MQTVPSLGEILQDLQQDANQQRIKKLLLLTCRNTWENDPSQLDQLDLTPLLEDLLQRYPSFDQLKAALSATVGRLSKKAEYAAVANLTLAYLKQLYPPLTRSVPQNRRPPQATATGNGSPQPVTPPELRSPSLTYPHQIQNGGELSSGSALGAPPAPDSYFQLVDYNPFDLRQDIIQQVNPLLVKVLIYSLLHHKLNLDESSFTPLKQHNLDQWIRQLLQACASPADLTAKLQETAHGFSQHPRIAQAVHVLLQCLTPLYIPISPPLPTEFAAAEAPADPVATAEIAEPESDMDWAAFPSTAPAGSPPLAAMPTDVPHPPRSELSATPPPLHLTPLPEINSADLDWMDQQVSQVASPTPAKTTTPASPPPSPALQSPSPPDRSILDQPIQDLVENNARKLMITIESSMDELGNLLDERLQDQDPEAYLALKHQVLRGFIGGIEASATTFLAILKRLEQAERRLLQAATDLPLAESPVVVNEDLYGALRQILEENALVQRKPDLDQDIKRMVRRITSAIKTRIENQLTEFGNVLDELFQDKSLQEGMTLKYQALRVFVYEIETISSKFAAILNKMEAAERKLFGV